MILTSDEERWIKKDEGYSSHPYKDTVGKLTIGYGRNIEDDGISPDEGELMFQNDLKQSTEELEEHDWYIESSDNIKKALINMNFNLGIEKLLGFKKMIAAIIDKNYTIAAMEALDSKWAIQVGQRAKEVAVMIRQG